MILAPLPDPFMWIIVFVWYTKYEQQESCSLMFASFLIPDLGDQLLQETSWEREQTQIYFSMNVGLSLIKAWGKIKLCREETSVGRGYFHWILPQNQWWHCDSISKQWEAQGFETHSSLSSFSGLLFYLLVSQIPHLPNGAALSISLWVIGE